MIDLRSDTVTRPSPGMRPAMSAGAPRDGGGVCRTPPPSNRLRGPAAEMFGFEAALLFPTGTQSNLAALMSHCGRGDEYLVGQEAPTYRYAGGGGGGLGPWQ